MSAPNHHLPDALLAAWVTGAVAPTMEVLVATHLCLCPHCRARAAALESVGGALLEAAPAGTAGEPAMSPGFHAALMARLDEVPAPGPPSPPRLDPSGRLPAVVHALVGDLDRVAWTWAGPGLAYRDLLDRSEGLPLRLMRFAPGHVVPVHDHSGDERAVVLEGGWTDQHGHFGRGDWCQVSRTVKAHRQVIDPGPPCLALVLNDAPAQVHNPVLRWLAGIKRI